MDAAALHCPACRPGARLDAAPGRYACPACDREWSLHVYPARARGLAPGRAGEALEAEGEAACYNHAERRAVAACEGCGRFLCALCDVTMHGKHLCPACIERGVATAAAAGLTRIVQYDRIALIIALFCSTLFYWAMPIGAPLVLFLCLYHWRSPRSHVPGRFPWRFLAAGLLAALQLVFLVSVLGAIVMGLAR